MLLIGKDKLMIHTANGIYAGNLKEPISYTDCTAQEGDDISTIAHKTYQSFISESDILKEKELVSENPITIELEDVTLITSNQKIFIPSVEIFVDQIIGFAIGSL